MPRWYGAIYIRRECLEICGIPCLNDQENTNSIIKDIAKEINVDITDTNMSPSHLLKSNVSYKGKSKNSPPIIVKFTWRVTKDKLYKAHKKLNRLTTKDLGYVIEQRIFIMESLTKTNKDLFNMAYNLKKKYQYKFIWTYNGNIYLWRNELSPVINIKNQRDIQHLREWYLPVNCCDMIY
jgi:hypothetical protein